MTIIRRVALGGVFCLLPGVAGAASAGPGGECVRADPASRTVRWNPPLDRQISLKENDAPLRSLVDRIALAAGFRISYASDALPLDRRGCASFDSVAAGDALAHLLRGSWLEPTALAANHVVLRPRRVTSTASAPSAEATAPYQLDPVVSEVRPVAGVGPDGGVTTMTLPVVAGRLAWERGGDAAESGGSRGWDLPGSFPSSLTSGASWVGNASWFGRVNRGASAFGPTYPKLYVDGIEVALPLLFGGVEPELIERVEVIRGPAGTALMGAGGADGVINIVTRHDRPTDGRLALSARTAGGVSELGNAGEGTMLARHAVAIRGAAGVTTVAAAASLRTTGAFADGATGRRTSGGASLRTVRGHSVWTLMGRVVADDARPGRGPLLSTAQLLALPSADDPLSTRQYTTGASLDYLPPGRFSYAATAGIDGYRLGGEPWPGLLPVQLDSAIRSLQGSGERVTLRATTRARFGDGQTVDGSVVAAIDHSSVVRSRPASGAGVASTGEAVWRGRESNSGLTTAGLVALKDNLFFEAGVRLERLADSRAARSATVLLPAVGGAYAFNAGGASLKFRAAAGRSAGLSEFGGIGAGSGPAGASGLDATRLTLRPRISTGVEGGVDARSGRFTSRATYFVQRVNALAPATGEPSGSAGVVIARENGAISNVGWELQAAADLGRLSVAGDLSLVNSRVVRAGEGGELAAGDRLLGVPSRSMGISAHWRDDGWATSWSLARAADWVGYDRIALGLASVAAGASQSGGGPALAGAALRNYWVPYGGVTRLGASFTRDVAPSWSLQLSGENLLDHRTGEPDNATSIPGRTLTLGIRVKR